MSLAECSSLHNKRRFLSDGNGGGGDGGDGGNNAKNEEGMQAGRDSSIRAPVVPKGSFENSEFAL